MTKARQITAIVFGIISLILGIASFPLTEFNAALYLGFGIPFSVLSSLLALFALIIASVAGVLGYLQVKQEHDSSGWVSLGLAIAGVLLTLLAISVVSNALTVMKNGDSSAAKLALGNISPDAQAYLDTAYELVKESYTNTSLNSSMIWDKTSCYVALLSQANNLMPSKPGVESLNAYYEQKLVSEIGRSTIDAKDRQLDGTISEEKSKPCVGEPIPLYMQNVSYKG